MRLLKVETREGLMHFVGNLGKVQSKAGLRGALDVLKVAEHPKDMAKLARLADAKGTKTRAIVKLLGRGAIVLTGALFDLALWVFWALLNLLAFCAACKRAVERMTLRHCERRRLKRLRGCGRCCLNGGGFPSRRHTHADISKRRGRDRLSRRRRGRSDRPGARLCLQQGGELGHAGLDRDAAARRPARDRARQSRPWPIGQALRSARLSHRHHGRATSRP